MLISPHFDLSEFTTSQIAERMGRSIIAPVEVVHNLEKLCFTVLEPLRAVVERPIIITSGYRPEWLNTAIRGAADSAHIYGCAADIVCPGMVALGVASRVGMMHAARIAEPPAILGGEVKHVPLLPELDQCILEFGKWVHVAVAKPGKEPRGEFLTARLDDALRVHYDYGLRP